jgi:hypothetical protein
MFEILKRIELLQVQYNALKIEFAKETDYDWDEWCMCQFSSPWERELGIQRTPTKISERTQPTSTSIKKRGRPRQNVGGNPE